MSIQTIVENTGNQAIINTDISKIFVWEPIDQSFDYTNGGGAAVTLLAGTLMGRISATGLLVPLVATVTDGSQFPLGVLMHDITVPAAGTASLTIAVSGHVAEDKLIIDAGDTLDSVIDGRRLRDRIGSDTVGILLVGGDELTGFDNQ